MSQKRKYCVKCGGRLNEKTGLCPLCDGWQQPKKSKGNPAVVFILLTVLLVAGIVGSLFYFEVLQVPELAFFEDVKAGFNTLTGRGTAPERAEEPREERREPAGEIPETTTVQTEAAEESAAAPATAPTGETDPVAETLPEFTVPEFTVPEFTLPEFTMPELTLPEEPEPESAPVAVESPVSKVSASSTYPYDVKSHDAKNLLDGDPTTNWAENVDGYGIGEYILFEFKDTYVLCSVSIRGGNRYDAQRYNNNARPKDVTLTFSDGTSESFTLTDEMRTQELTLSDPIRTSSVKITIDSVYEGYARKGVDQDTVISDVFFEAYEQGRK